MSRTVNRRLKAARRRNPKKREKGVLLNLWENFLTDMDIDTNLSDFDQQLELITNIEILKAFEQYIFANVDGVDSLADIQINSDEQLADLTTFEIGQYYVPGFENEVAE